MEHYLMLQRRKFFIFFIPGKQSSIAPISANEKSTIIFLGFQVGFACLITSRTSWRDSLSSFWGMNTAITM